MKIHNIQKTSLIIALSIMLLLNACASSLSGVPESDDAIANPAEENTTSVSADPQDDPGNMEIVEKKDIIVSVVELQGGAYISKVVLFLPDDLFDTNVSVNGNQDKIIVVWEPADKSVSIHLFSMPEVSNAEITFTSDDTLLAACVITMEDSIIPSGDCSW
ncbi:MAG: hypothetical protein MUO76_02940 [Anaerolineaceae bacterium]|nr:hypothetical protein [Anaerolineaceae bacterium]